MQELIHDDFKAQYEVAEALREKLNLKPATVTVIEDYEHELIELQYGDQTLVVTLKGASDLTMRLHRAIAKIRKASHNHPKNRG